MHDKFRKARQHHICTGCKNIIKKGTQYYHCHPDNYHTECLPKTEAPLETKVGTIPEVKNDPEPKPTQPRDARGRFIGETGGNTNQGSNQ